MPFTSQNHASSARFGSIARSCSSSPLQLRSPPSSCRHPAGGRSTYPRAGPIVLSVLVGEISPATALRMKPSWTGGGRSRRLQDALSTTPAINQQTNPTSLDPPTTRIPSLPWRAPQHKQMKLEYIPLIVPSTAIIPHCSCGPWQGCLPPHV